MYVSFVIAHFTRTINIDLHYIIYCRKIVELTNYLIRNLTALNKYIYFFLLIEERFNNIIIVQQ